ncbi:MAG: hypothetical protein MJZ08_07930 [Bacteroidaceae bacterium]|nr:hypothetical protein [Bacteroidaceae bacterium]
MYFFLIDNPGRRYACPGLIGVSLSGYSFLQVERLRCTTPPNDYEGLNA